MGPWVAAIQSAFTDASDAQQAAPMQAYMLHQFAFLGIRAPLRRSTLKAALQGISKADFTASLALDMAAALWLLPEREYQYAGVDVLTWQAKKLTPQDLPALQHLVEQKSWWDSVDGLAGVVGTLLLQSLQRQATQTGPSNDSPAAGVQQAMDAWVTHPSLWVRRVAMLHQLGWRAHTDAARLWRYALVLAPEKDFFIRKAIGWALRDYARTQPEAVAFFVQKHRGQLSPLTVREAAKHLALD